MSVSRCGTLISCLPKRGNSLNLKPVGVNQEGGLLGREYNLSVSDINDTGSIIRPRDGVSIQLTDLAIVRRGEEIGVFGYEYAEQILGAAICGCGKEVNRKRICLLLDDGSVLYPALCCRKAVFFDGVVDMND